MAIDYTKRPKPTGDGGSAAPAAAGKVTLTKAAPRLSLTKQGSTGGTMRVNLNWNSRPAAPAPSGGLLKRLTGAASGGSGGVDLDLGCLYEYADGSKGVVQALGNAFRDRHGYGAEPMIWLDGDDRSGTTAGGENLFVDLSHPERIRRILVFALIYEGSPNWAEADAVVTLFPVSGPQVELRLDEHDSRSRLCSIALLENRAGEVEVKREVTYIQGAQDALDRAYGWGMRWGVGRK